MLEFSFMEQLFHCAKVSEKVAEAPSEEAVPLPTNPWPSDSFSSND
jgi:hypothetical protein